MKDAMDRGADPSVGRPLTKEFSHGPIANTVSKPAEPPVRNRRATCSGNVS
jgi:hypothetical protein